MAIQPNTFPPPTGQKYLVIAHAMDGLGDISCAMKVAYVLHKRLEVPKEDILISTNRLEKARLLNNRQFTLLSDEDALETPSSNIFLQIAPSVDVRLITEFVGRGIRTLVINEYGLKTDSFSKTTYPWISFQNFGCHKGALGIQISNSLKRYGFEKPSGLNNLNEVDAVLKETILQGQTSQQFDLSHRLYLGYSSTIQASLSYIGAVCYLNQNNSKHIICIVPNLKTSSYDFKNLKSELESTVCATGVGSIEYISYALGTSVKTDQKTECSSASKKLTLIYGPINRQDLKRILMASEKEILVTGDQSFTESVSANKSWIYETRGHKTALAKEIQTIALQTGITEGLCYPAETMIPTLTYCSNMAQDWQTRGANGYALSTALNQHFITHFDCFSNLKNAITEAVSNPAYQPPVVLTTYPLTSNDLPFNMLMILNSQQIISLKINTETGISSVPGFEDSIFETTRIGFLSGQYLLKRLKKS